jgi:enediyne biosynthesis thioesterase
MTVDPRRAYELRHVVTLQETNVLGNVYFVNHLVWQGHCREMFLKERAPEVLAALSNGLVLATVRCSCEYFAELAAFDEIVMHMRLGDLLPTRLSLLFDYMRVTDRGEERVARGEQVIACLRRAGAACDPCPLPAALVEALRPYGADRLIAGGSSWAH